MLENLGKVLDFTNQQMDLIMHTDKVTKIYSGQITVNGQSTFIVREIDNENCKLELSESSKDGMTNQGDGSLPSPNTPDFDITEGGWVVGGWTGFTVCQVFNNGQQPILPGDIWYIDKYLYSNGIPRVIAHVTVRIASTQINRSGIQWGSANIIEYKLFPYGSVEVDPIAISIVPSQIHKVAGQYADIDVVFTPSNATERNLTWFSSDSNVAISFTESKIYCQNMGFCTITATTDNGLTASCDVYVSAAPIPVTGIFIQGPTVVRMAENDTYQLAAVIQPANADDQGISWSTSNPAVATVDSNGLVTTLDITADTNVVIVATSNDGAFTAGVTIYVENYVPVTSVSFATSSITVDTGLTVPLTAAVLPADATYPTLTWSSDNSSVAQVTQNGVVSGLAVGSANVTATSDDVPSLSAVCAVSVVQSILKPPIEVMESMRGNITLYTGTTYPTRNELLHNNAWANSHPLLTLPMYVFTNPKNAAYLYFLPIMYIDLNDGNGLQRTGFRYLTSTLDGWPSKTDYAVSIGTTEDGSDFGGYGPAFFDNETIINPYTYNQYNRFIGNQSLSGRAHGFRWVRRRMPSGDLLEYQLGTATINYIPTAGNPFYDPNLTTQKTYCVHQTVESQATVII